MTAELEVVVVVRIEALRIGPLVPVCPFARSGPSVAPHPWPCISTHMSATFHRRSSLKRKTGAGRGPERPTDWALEIYWDYFIHCIALPSAESGFNTRQCRHASVVIILSTRQISPREEDGQSVQAWKAVDSFDRGANSLAPLLATHTDN
ncbi:hypothetical protein P154DRAFT_606332 [Amniculicola lignicola CBS 123094]|uniref:Uncharacterized protein n=1 Tax=Amniculicola lignicola CBS 123094 TaxID=1392246 RepID=A0A6A5WW18_9PLEO|nr:hypothetical protein P154DRAFT_606332 [Amniculicola lignicola CBS 123094]